jgi:Family of unknown function (DUF6084)
MTELRFAVRDAKARHFSALPTIVFKTQIDTSEPLEAMVLRAQIRIEPQWRQYEAREETLLSDLFGTPERWNTTLRSFSWSDISVTVAAFAESIAIELSVPCSYDFDVTATRFLSALGGGEIPLRFLFSGAIFRTGDTGFSTERVSWSSECAYRMPIEVWREALAACYGDDALLRIKRETLEELHRYRARSGATSWDEVLQRLLGAPR